MEITKQIYFKKPLPIQRILARKNLKSIKSCFVLNIIKTKTLHNKLVLKCPIFAQWTNINIPGKKYIQTNSFYQIEAS